MTNDGGQLQNREHLSQATDRLMPDLDPLVYQICTKALSSSTP